MTKEDIIRMAQEARMRKTFVCEKPEDCPDDDDCCHKQVPEGLHGTPEIIERFANLIAAAEREACAKLCDKQANNLWQKNCDSEGHGADQCAAVIRARGLDNLNKEAEQNGEKL